jgi:hypothetical protein
VAHALEPGVRLQDVLFPYMQVLPVAMNQLEPERPPQPVADGDAADAARQCRAVRLRHREMMREDQVTRESQQGLIGDRQSYNPEYQQEEYRQIPILRDPL